MQMKKTILLFLFGTITMAVLLRFQGKPLNTSHAPLGIVSMELANTLNKTNAVVSDWKSGFSDVFYQNVLLDFLFICLYGGLFYSLSRYFAIHFPSLKKAGIHFSRLAIVAALLDVFENSLMLVSFSGHVHSLISFFTFLFASLKFILLAAIIVFLLFAWVFTRRLRKIIKN